MLQSPNPMASPGSCPLMDGSKARGRLISPSRNQPYTAEERQLQLGRAFVSSTIWPPVFKHAGEELQQRNNRDFG